MKLRRPRSVARAASAAATAVLALTIGAAGAGTAHAQEAPAGEAANPCHYSTATPALQLGDTGPAVKQAQCYLLHTLIIDDIIEVSGTFDQKTEIRVGQFQRCAGLPSNGVVGATTWSAMERFINSGRVC